MSAVRSCFIVALALMSLGFVHTARGQSSNAPSSEPTRPNVVFILADDLGWTDLACYGSTYYETPNLDRLAAQGMKFTSGYACGPNCAPTRAALMTGQYGPRTGIYSVGDIFRFNWQTRPLVPVKNDQNLPLEKMTVANAMKQAGYSTAMFGKWHLGSSAKYHPSARGFDEALVTSGKHFDFKLDPPTEYPKGQYLADFLTDRAVDFIGRNKDGPFFLYLPHFGVHGPHQAKSELIERFKKKPAAGGHHDPTYAAMIYSIDEAVGHIMKTLDELGIAENTLVIFSSDNGGVGGYQAAGLKEMKGITDNAPLRGGKGMLYEGGVRVPFIVRWPGKISPGSESAQPVCSVDLFPTLTELAGAQPPSPQEQPMDGVSIVPLLNGSSDSRLAREDIFWHFPGYLGGRGDAWRTAPVGAIRSGDYKLLEFFEDSHLELYNLKDDLSQKLNLAEREPDRAKAMHEKLVAWRESIGAKMPKPNTDRQPADAPRRRKPARDPDDE